MAEKIDFSKVRFLIVDNNTLSLQMLEDILRMLGTTAIRRATDSTKAKAALREGEIDIVITERELEPESGIELVDHIRHSTESLDRLMPVIMLTARSENEYVTEARDKGVTEFLAKPFNVDSLYRRIAAVIARPRPFINAPQYFGPDRRRRQQAYSGPNRRS
ncbi:MAG: response regulator [Alphaproteobacteria bacterium]|nr:response regulator [Alphaproteobacteria bacterium]